jgi:methyl acetate hydrolase
MEATDMEGETRVVRQCFLCAVIVGGLLTSSLTGIAGTGTNLIDSVLRNAVELNKVPGAVAMVANADGVVYQGAFGKRADGYGIPMTMDTIFRIASMTKPVTSVAVMQLVELGKVKLDEPAGTYLPELSRALVLDGTEASTGKAILRPPKTPITVRQLLTHTSGFVYDTWDTKLRDYRAAAAAVGTSGGDLPAEPLMFDPGTRWEYGTSTAWLGRLVEAVSGQTLEDYFRQHICQPLGMTDTSFNVSPAKQTRLVTLHQRMDDGNLVEVPQPPLEPVKVYRGDGGLYSTAPDYVKFMRMLLGGGQLGKVRILRPETVAMMRTNQIGALNLSEFKSTDPNRSKDGQVPGSLDKFGLGFALNTKPVESGRGAGSMAWAGLDNTYFWIDPAHKTCAVILMQILPFLDDAPVGVLRDFERAVYASRRD